VVLNEELRREEAVAARIARDEAAAREWRLHFWSRDGVKQLHSALKLAEVRKKLLVIIENHNGDHGRHVIVTSFYYAISKFT
jgi:hypothetical protein